MKQVLLSALLFSSLHARGQQISTGTIAQTQTSIQDYDLYVKSQLETDAQTALDQQAQYESELLKAREQKTQ